MTNLLMESFGSILFEFQKLGLGQLWVCCHFLRISCTNARTQCRFAKVKRVSILPVVVPKAGSGCMLSQHALSVSRTLVG